MAARARPPQRRWRALAFGAAASALAWRLAGAHARSRADDRAAALHARVDALTRRLAQEVAAGDEVRRAAAASQRAKTQFFAAASHDLRQPLHAMALFAQALRQRTHGREPEVAELADRIGQSVDALDALFGELLDLTRLDAGGVELRTAPVAMDELFERLRLAFEVVAFEKGLMLSFRGRRHVAHADPVLLERVLRNLVSNAVRYTDDGGVLVGCRARGDRLLLQVWDSGIGIAAAALPRVFDEFFQVPAPSVAATGAPRAPRRTRGLGLGLAIVRRLAALMQLPLTVHSRVGHGTVFSLLLPAAAPAAFDTPDARATEAGAEHLTVDDALADDPTRGDAPTGGGGTRGPAGRGGVQAPG